MNKIIKNFVLAGDKYLRKMYLKEPGFAYNAWGPFTKKKENSF